MTLPELLAHWTQGGLLKEDQKTLLTARVQQNPFSVFFELNALLYAGVIALVGGFSWTIQTYFKDLGDIAILIGLTLVFGSCLFYCFHQALPYRSQATEQPQLTFDYVLYLGCLTWSIELGYIEWRYHLLAQQWDYYLLASSLFFFVMAYRFDNRLVLSMALSTLASWFGVRLPHWTLGLWDEMSFRTWGIPYGLAVIGAGARMKRSGVKAHFFSTFLHVGLTTMFWAMLSGIFTYHSSIVWFVGLLALTLSVIAYGIRTAQFSMIAYASIYGYIGLSKRFLENIHESLFTWLYFLLTGAAMTVFLIYLARRFAKSE